MTLFTWMRTVTLTEKIFEYVRIILGLNGLILTSKEGLLDSVAEHIYRLGVPLDGPNAQINDMMRSTTGAYRKCLDLLSKSNSNQRRKD